MSKATSTELDDLHGLQAEALKEELRRQKESGEGISPALLAQVNKFLKDNGIDRPKAEGNGPDLLNDELEELEFDETVVQFDQTGNS
jgi:hypothetical protein